MKAGQVEIRQAEGGPLLFGTILQEGRAATGGRAEVFAPGAAEWPSEGVGILLAHRQAPETRAFPKREGDGRITIATPASPAIREAVEGGRRFMSVEFHALQERTTRGGVREIQRAYIPDVALVAEPEYDSTLAEVRQRGGFRTEMKPRRRMDCRCAGQGAGKDVVSIQFDTGAFEEVLREVEAGRRNVSAISRGAGDVVADTRTGSLVLEEVDGGLGIRFNPLDTEAGRRVAELIEAGVSVFARPVVDFELSGFTLDGPLAVVRRALFWYILVKPTDRTEGLEALRAARDRENRRGRARVERSTPLEAILTRSAERRRIWL